MFFYIYIYIHLKSRIESPIQSLRTFTGSWLGIEGGGGSSAWRLLGDQVVN